jgi:phosphomannomutase
VKSNPLKFGTSGWRAIIAEEFTFANMRLVMTAIGEHVRNRKNKPTLIVGYDTRFLSPEFARTAAQILAAQGIRVLLCDAPAPTPAIAWEILQRKCDGAVNFTASHNPPEYNGIKFSGPHGGPALPHETRDIEARIARLAAKPIKAVGGHSHEAEEEFERISPRPTPVVRPPR